HTRSYGDWSSDVCSSDLFDFRTLGLGYANLGALLMVQGIPYDSVDGRAQAGALTALMHATSYATSAEIAAEAGPYPRYDANRDVMLRVVRNHRRNLDRKSTRLNSSHRTISYAVFCLKKKTKVSAM